MINKPFMGREATKIVKKLLDAAERELTEADEGGEYNMLYLEGYVAGIQECLTALHEAEKKSRVDLRKNKRG